MSVACVCAAWLSLFSESDAEVCCLKVKTICSVTISENKDKHNCLQRAVINR